MAARKSRMPKLIFTGPDALVRIQVYEEAQLAEPVALRESELTPNHTEPMLRRLITSRFACYLEERDQGKYDGPLLRELKRDIALYRLLIPWFWPKAVSSISDLQALVDHLPQGMNTPWRNGDDRVCSFPEADDQ